jgi:hypothetical protein
MSDARDMKVMCRANTARQLQKLTGERDVMRRDVDKFEEHDRLLQEAGALRAKAAQIRATEVRVSTQPL